MKECQVIVVGAGISGLCAAKWLHEAGIDVIVLEARDRVGGRTWTVRNPKVGYVDLGGSYVGPTQNHLLRIAKELKIETYKVDETQDLIYYSNGKSKPFACDALPPVGSFMAELDLNNFFRVVDKMGEEIPAHAPWEAPHAWEWDRKTYKEFIDEVCYTKEAKDFAIMFINLVLTAEPWEASLLWALWYIKICGGLKRDLSTTNGGQERKFVGGSQQISEKIAKILGPEKVILSQPVCQVTQADGVVIVRALDGTAYKGDYIILATPPAVQGKIHYTPQLPALRNQLIQRLPAGSVMKCILYYKTAFWKDLGYCGSMLIVEDGEEFDMQFTLNDTKPDGSFPAIVGFIATDRLRRNFDQLTPAERMSRLSANFEKVFNSREALSPIHYEEKCWSEEQYSGGCYATVFPPGLLTTHGKVLRQPIGKMYFAGTETAIAWSCYMDGAVSSGERAAREILHDMGKLPKNKIWVEEPESKDVPALPFDQTFWEIYAPSAHCVAKIGKVLKWSIGTVAAYYAFKRFASSSPNFNWQQFCQKN